MSIIARSIASIGVTQNPFAMASVGYLANNQSGRSGVNRMLLMQLQEESLRQDELRKKAQEQKNEKPEDQRKPKKTKVSKKVKRRVEKKPVEIEDNIPILGPLPAFTRVPDQPNFATLSISISQQVHFLLTQYKVKVLNFEQHKKQFDTDDEDVELLLLSI